MRQRKFKFLFVALLVATGLLFSGGEARAAILSYNLSTISRTPLDVVTSQTYSFSFTPNTGSLTIGHVNVSIPKNIEIPEGLFTNSKSNANYSFTVSIQGNATVLSGEVFGVGRGDLGTKYGVGDASARVMKITVPALSSFTILLTITATENPPGMTLGTVMGVVLVKAGNGSNTQSFYPVDTPAWIPLAKPGLTNVSVNPNPIVPPGCATITYSSETGVTYSITSSPELNLPDQVSVTGPGVATACIATPGTYILIIKATSSSGASSEATTTVTVEMPPPIEHACQTIVKNSVPPTCVHMCYEKGGSQELLFMNLYQNDDCSGTVFTPIKIHIPGVDPPLLICAPCGTPGTVPCSGNPNPSLGPPFDVNQGSHTVKCDVFKFEYETRGFTAEIGADPCGIRNGRFGCW